MNEKPEACQGCPLYGDGRGFVPDELLPGAPVLILGQNPGADEEAEGRPFIGRTGQEMERRFFPLAGLKRGDNVSIGNLLKCRAGDGAGGKTNDLPSGVVLKQVVDHCTRAHLRIPPETQLVVAQGAHTFKWASGARLTKPDYKTGGVKPATVTDWRGFLLPEPLPGTSVPVFQVIHVAELFRDNAQNWVAEFDWKRIAHVLEGTYPTPIPSVDMDIGVFFRDAERAEFLVIDTEYVDSKWMTMLGLACEVDGHVRSYQLDWRTAEPWERDSVSRLLSGIVGRVPVVFQNYAADMPVLRQNCGIQYHDYRRVDDTMLAHAVLWCELPHDLEFLASIYGRYRKLKHLSQTDLLLYNQGDVLETLEVWKALRVSLKYDTGANHVYESQSLRLIPILLATMDRGIRVNKDRVLAGTRQYEGIVDRATAMAHAYTGWPFNLGSRDHIIAYCESMGFEVPLAKRRGSKQESQTVDGDAIAELRGQYGIPFDPQKELTFDTGDDEHESIVDRIEQGADPILELRAIYAYARYVLSDLLYPLRDGDGVVDRVYPHIAIHTQTSGRHSTTHPPLATLPSNLRDIICPDVGEVWIAWDWEQIEPRILWAYCGSKVLGGVFEKGHDLHTVTYAMAFKSLGAVPPPDPVDPHKGPLAAEWRKQQGWGGKSDPRRVFAKQLRLKMNYGAYPRSAGDTPGAKQLGLSASVLQQIATDLLNGDPEYAMYQRQARAEARTKKIIRSFDGRPRRLLGKGKEIEREALNHPMQAGNTAIYNYTIIQLDDLKLTLFVWGMHDSQNQAIKVKDLNQYTLDVVKAVVEQPWTINGVSRPIPADMKVIFPPEYSLEEQQCIMRGLNVKGSE